MNDPLRRLRSGLYLLGAVFVLSVAGFRLLAGYSWLESVWMVVITLSTVGYGERPAQPPLVQGLTILVIVGGLTSLALTSSVILHAIVDGDVRRYFGVRKLNQHLAQLDRHVIICGFGRLGQDVAAQLGHRRIDCVAIDRSDAWRETRWRNGDGVTVLHGDATSEELLLRAGLARARSIVCALPNDAENVFVALTARNISPRIQIIARAEQPSSCRKLRQAGADRIVMPHHSGAQQMERMISRPTTADLLELLTEASNDRIELDELGIDSHCRIAGQPVGPVVSAAGLIAVGIRNAGGDLQFNPPASSVLQAGDCLLVMGSQADIQRFRGEWCL